MKIKLERCKLTFVVYNKQETTEDGKARLSQFDLGNRQSQCRGQSYHRNQYNLILVTFKQSFKFVTFSSAEILPQPEI